MFDGEAGFTRRLSSLGADEPSLLAFAHQDGIHSGDERMLRLIAATSRCPFRARDGVLLNVECFGPAYKGDDDQDDDDRSGNVDSSQNSDTPYNHNVHRRSTHNSDQWPLVSQTFICFVLVPLCNSIHSPHPGFILPPAALRPRNM